MRIVQTCDAMEVNILLAAALAGFPMPLGRRAASVLVSVLSLTLVNVIACACSYWLGSNAPAWFNRTTTRLWRMTLTA